MAARGYDVAIAGAGPAGSLAALLLARRGLRVALVDRSQFPRPKVCGDCLHPGCAALLERHGLADAFRRLPGHHPRGFCLRLNGRTIFQAPFVPGREVVIEREILDEWLFSEAVAAGAVPLLGQAVSGLLAEGGLRTTAGDVPSRFVVGADGRNSVVARQSGLLQGGHRCRRIAWQAQIPGHFATDDIVLDVFPNGHFGLVRTQECRANLCFVLGSSLRRPPHQLARSFLPGLEPATWRSIYPLSRAPAAPTNGAVWLAGDAQRVVEPFTGQGIFLALASAERLAGELASACGGLSSVEEAARRYAVSLRALHRATLGPNRLAAAFLRHPRLAPFALRLLALCPAALNQLFDQTMAMPKEMENGKWRMENGQ